ncbi:VOC family protein [Methylobacterium sp. WL9]|uniref:VOC family protein n=1 Tax=Methylobacterium sp. WL9 TaxID=2603898 RepID=UPI00164F3E17|nr:VOC family protein [Methylobacterium sp. WL9]
MSVERIARIGLNAADPDRLAAFYEAAFGFLREGDVEWAAEPASRLFGMAVARARVVSLRLDEQRVDLVGLIPQGAPYPGDVPGWSSLFQHFAMIVPDMEAAYARLSRVPGWQPISQGGPQRLPEASGGVTAFKFRDPEGHPLELLAFPPGGAPEIWRPTSERTCLGIDHSAISVADTARSIAFYESLGFRVSSRSHNLGPEQARLDGIERPDVAVTGLSLPGGAPPHLELLCYRTEMDRAQTGMRAVDDVATRLVLAVTDAGTLSEAWESLAAHRVSAEPVIWPDGRTEALLRDPDGHHLLLTAPA